MAQFTKKHLAWSSTLTPSLCLHHLALAICAAHTVVYPVCTSEFRLTDVRWNAWTLCAVCTAWLFLSYLARLTIMAQCIVTIINVEGHDMQDSCTWWLWGVLPFGAAMLHIYCQCEQLLPPLAMQVAYSSRVHAERLCITLPNACNQGWHAMQYTMYIACSFFCGQLHGCIVLVPW